jgi:hypothetical protein
MSARTLKRRLPIVELVMLALVLLILALLLVPWFF